MTTATTVHPSRPTETVVLPTPELAAELQVKENEIDAQFRDDVAKASEKRTKALSKLPHRVGDNLAEIAWDETKAEGDPVYVACASDYKGKLDTAVQSIRATGSAGIVGLEAFEERVKELLAEEKEALAPTKLAKKVDSGK